jgi:hypothetical protein
MGRRHDGVKVAAVFAASLLQQPSGIAVGMQLLKAALDKNQQCNELRWPKQIFAHVPPKGAPCMRRRRLAMAACFSKRDVMLS